jgi:hypothetical protein
MMSVSWFLFKTPKAKKIASQLSMSYKIVYFISSSYFKGISHA